ncbi:MAG TPA: FkbM family methyltransferase [Burkholderiaceae bacterium]|nr:FkbM family methyltransferase [Burkholderiaceae bacterium]
MSPYEKLAARLIGTPLQRPAQWVQHWRGRHHRAAHPELAEWFMEGERTEQALRRVMTRDTNAIDIGCHIGSFLQKLTTLAPAAHHHAFEPVPDKAAWLQRKFPSVTVVACALGASAGEAEFFVNDAHTSYSSLKPRTVDGAVQVRAVRVPVRTLDEAIPRERRIGFIKIDVNGAELGVLQGALGLLHRDRPFVLFECTKGGLDDFGIDAGEVFAFVTGPAGYRIQLLRHFLADGPALDLPGFRRSMEYPFEAFNYALVPA